MSDCPICGTDAYTWKTGCGECGHYDEDGHRLESREQQRFEDRDKQRRGGLRIGL